MAPTAASADEHEDAPAGHRLRRAATSIEEATALRQQRRPTSWASAPDDTFGPSRRRSSNFSDFSQDARSLLNPLPDLDRTTAGDAEGGTTEQPGSHWETVPLVLALLPAVAGVIFQGGSAVATDLILLSFGALFLHWAVTQPWSWYHSAQQVRAAEEEHVDLALESDSDDEPPLPASDLNDIPEEDNAGSTEEDESELLRHARAVRSRQRRMREAALKGLYRHEVWALLSCFIAPVLGAYILHHIRNQLTRPAEGLVSNYNLTIFILMSEIRPLRQIIKLVRARTLRLQRIVHSNPYRDKSAGSAPGDLEFLVRRIEELEARLEEVDATAEHAEAESKALKRVDARREKEDIIRAVRSQLQPDLDTLARSLRRSHKDQLVLAAHIEKTNKSFDRRLNDAYNLASVAVDGNESTLGWLVSWIPWFFKSLLNGLVKPVQLPLQVISGLMGGRKTQKTIQSERAGRISQAGRSASQPKQRKLRIQV